MGNQGENSHDDQNPSSQGMRSEPRRSDESDPFAEERPTRGHSDESSDEVPQPGHPGMSEAERRRASRKYDLKPDGPQTPTSSDESVERDEEGVPAIIRPGEHTETV